MPFQLRSAGFLRAHVLSGSAFGLICLWGAPAGAQQEGDGPVLLPTLSVEGGGQGAYRADLSALPKLTEPLRETPQSITVVPRQVIDDQGVTSLRDTLRNVAGISLAAGEAGAQGDNLTLRGFSARNDIFLDDMRDFGSYYRDSFDYEEVEVLQGPSSILFGRGSTGGVVNQVSKSPRLDPFVAGSVALGTDQTKRVTADINRTLPELGEGAAVRLNAMGNDSGFAGRDFAEYRRAGAAASLALGTGTPTRLAANYVHQSENDIPDYGIPWLLSRPAPVSRNNYYGFKDASYLRTGVDIGTARIEHDFDDSLTLRNQLRYAGYSRAAQITEAQVPATVTAATPLAAITVTRNQIAVYSAETSFDNQTDLTAKFSIGGIEHALVTGIEIGRETSDPKRATFVGVPGTNLLFPDASQPFSLTASSITSNVAVTADSVAAYALDTLKVGERWALTGGLRWDRFAAHYRQSVAPVASFSRVDETPSWRAALVYKPLPNGSGYFAYGTSFNPSAEALSLASTSAGLPPEKNQTFEIGSKWDLFDETLSLRAALFRTAKLNARETDPNNPLLQRLSGDQQVDGFETEAAGRLTDAWQVYAGYAYLDGKVVASINPLAVGHPISNAPKHSFNLWTTYALPGGVQIGGGVNYISSRNASTTPDATTGLIRRLPGYWVANAMMKYTLTDSVDLQLNVTNLTDAYYFDEIHPAHIVPGAARTAIFTTNFKF